MKLFLSANPNSPRIHLTNMTFENPSTPPNFCMVLRKYLTGGKVLDIEWFGFERIVALNIESSNEMGEFSNKKLIIEIMGRHSNIILVNYENKIFDSIKHIDNEISTKREIMPARDYVLPPSQDKVSIENLNIQKLLQNAPKHIDISDYLLNNIKGFSKLLCDEVCIRAKVTPEEGAQCLHKEQQERLGIVLQDLIKQINDNDFTPCIILDNENTPKDYYSLAIEQNKIKRLHTISQVLDEFYSNKDKFDRINRLKQELRNIVNNFIKKSNKKITLNEEIIQESSNVDKYKLFGELILSNKYRIPENSKVAYVEKLLFTK
jgi:predicted ribosome quality control (RQC) complex YloA/Tae2 family protein